MNIPSPRMRPKARIEIIPLIDIIFFLLAAFVMISMSMIKNQGISVNRPVASTSQSQERKDYTTLSITADGQFFFNKEAVSWTQLVERLSGLKANDPEPRVFINGDAKAEFGQAVAMLDEVRKLGITKISIETVIK